MVKSSININTLYDTDEEQRDSISLQYFGCKKNKTSPDGRVGKDWKLKTPGCTDKKEIKFFSYIR
jgi:hypothetical protein